MNRRRRFSGTVRWAGALWLGLVACLACVDTRRVTAPVPDYHQYRAVRGAATFEQRLRAGWTYLRRFPEGTFRGEVRAWFTPAEERFVRRAWNDTSRLYGYLEVLPDGPHAGEVKRRLFELEQKARAEAADETSFMRQERERQQAFDRAAARRVEFQRALSDWVGRLSGLRGYGKAMSEWPLGFKQAFFEAEPPGLCEESQCEKTHRFEFEMPVQTGLATRAVSFTTRMHLQDGALYYVTVTGYDLFNALAESVSREHVLDDDLQARAEAIGTAVQFVEMALEPAFPAQRCAAEAISPTVLFRACDGQSVEMRIGDGLETPDLIEWRVAPSEPAPVAPPTGTAPPP